MNPLWNEGHESEPRTHSLGKVMVFPGHDVLVVPITISRVLLEDHEVIDEVAGLVGDMAQKAAEKAVRERMWRQHEAT